MESSRPGSPAARFRELIAGPDALMLPGVHNALSARLAERAGARAVYLSGSAVSMALLGLPDIGLMSGTEMVDQARRITACIGVPLICDADTGYGNAVNVLHAVRMYEAAGVAGIQIEDQMFPKRCGHFDGKSLISEEEMIGKIRAACAARVDSDFVIIARTDAIEELGVDAAVQRGQAYGRAGADIVFVEAPRTLDDMRLIASSIDAPLLINVVEGGKTPQLSLRDYAELGYRIVLYPTTNVRVTARALDDLYRFLLTEGTTEGYPGGMLEFDERNSINELNRYQEWERTYVPPPKHLQSDEGT